MNHPVFFASLLCVVAVSGVTRAAGDDDAMSVTARELFTKASNAASRQDWEGCKAALQAAWGIKPHWQIAGNLGGCEIELGQFRVAAEHLHYSVANATSQDAEAAAKSAQLLAEAQKHVGTYRLRVEPPTARVEVDGVSLRDTSVPLFLDPGPHQLRVAVGDASRAMNLDVTAGEDRELDLTWVEAPEPSAAPEAPVPSEPPAPGRSVVPIVIGGAVAAVGIGVGVGLLVAAGGKQSDAEDAGAKVRALGGSCDPVSPNSVELCARGVDALSAKDSLHTGAAVSFSVGAAAAVFTVTYALWPRSKPASKTTTAGIHPVPWVGLDVGGLSISGKF